MMCTFLHGSLLIQTPANLIVLGQTMTAVHSRFLILFLKIFKQVAATASSHLGCRLISSQISR